MNDFTPEGFEPADDMVHSRPEDTENWSESYAFWAYWEEQYLYMHFQRHPEDVEVWRAYAAIMGEDGSILASHGFGRELSPFGPGFQQIRATCERPYETYRVEVDSIAQVSDRATLHKQGLSGLDEHVTPLQLDLQFTSVSATYAPIRGNAAGTSSIGAWTQYTPCKVQGYVTIGGERKYIDVLGYRDHSCGPRKYDKMGSGYMLTGIMPSGRSFMSIGVTSIGDDGETSFSGLGAVTIDGQVSYATRIEQPEKIVTFPEANTDVGVIVFETEHGESSMKVRTTSAGIPFTHQHPNYEAIGILPNAASFYHDWRVEIEWDGEKGIGSWESSLRVEE